ncbi:hypothetical protein ABPG75_013460 [Micractinium tetrahymenae]
MAWVAAYWNVLMRIQQPGLPAAADHRTALPPASEVPRTVVLPPAPVRMRALWAILLLAVACGASAERHLLDASSAQIVNGTNASCRYSWMVSLRDPKDETFQFCGGSLIHPRIVLTAAHCLMNDTTGVQNDGLPVAYIGKYSDADAAGTYERRKVIAKVTQPGYVYANIANANSDNLWNDDIALLLLGSPSSQATVDLPPYPPRSQRPLAPPPARHSARTLSLLPSVGAILLAGFTPPQLVAFSSRQLSASYLSSFAKVPGPI